MTKLQSRPGQAATRSRWPARYLYGLTALLAALVLASVWGGWQTYRLRVSSEIESLKAAQRTELERQAFSVVQRLQREVANQLSLAALASQLTEPAIGAVAANERKRAETMAGWLARYRSDRKPGHVRKIVWRMRQAAPLAFSMSDQAGAIESSPGDALSALARMAQARGATRAAVIDEPPFWSPAAQKSLWRVLVTVGFDAEAMQGVMLFEIDLGAMLEDVSADLPQPYVSALVNKSAQVLWSDQQRAWTPGADLAQLAPKAWEVIASSDQATYLDSQWHWVSRTLNFDLMGSPMVAANMHLVSMQTSSKLPGQVVVEELRNQTAWQALLACLLLSGVAVALTWYQVARRGLRPLEEERLSALIDTLLDAVILRDSMKRVVRANEAGHELIDTGFLQALERERGTAAQASSEPLALEWSNRQGQSQSHEVRVTAYRWGWLECELIVARSHTELMRAQSQRDATQRMLSELSMFAVFRGDCVIVELDERLCQVFGRDRSELVGTDYRTLLFMEVLSSESFDTCWARLVKGDTVQRTMRLRSPSGVSHDLDAVFLPEFGADGQLLRVLFSARDVTDLTRWRADADRSKRLLDTLLAISESAFVILDTQRNIFSASEQLGRYLNCDVAGLIGKPWSEFLEPGSSELDFHFLHSAELGSDRPFSIRLRPAGDQVIPLDAKAGLVAVDAQEYVVIELADRAEFAGLRERLNVLQKLVDESAMMLELDELGHFVSANDRWLERFSPLAPPETTQALWHYCPPGASNKANADSAIRAEMEVLAASGQHFWVESFALSIPDLAHGGHRLCILSFDISELAESKLRATEAEERYRLHLGLGFDGYLTLGVDGRIRDANPAICQMLSYSHAELCSLNISEVDKGSSLPRILERIAKEGATYAPRGIESVMRTSDMSLTPVLLKASTTTLTGDFDICIAVKSLSELQYQRSAMASLRTALNTTHMVLELDEMGNFLTANQSFLKCFGRIEAECVGRPFRGFEKENISRRTMTTGAAAASVGTWEAEHHRFDRTSVWLRSTAIPVKAVNGKGDAVMVLSSDITASVLARQALEQERALTQTYMESMPVGIFVHDPFGQFTEANKAFCEMVGMARDELINTSMFDIEVGIGVERLTELWGSLTGEQQQVRYEGTGLQPGGRRVPWRINLAAIEVNGERRLLGGARDLTIEREIEGILQRQTHALDLSHMVIRLDPSWRIIDANAKFLERFDTSLAEVIGQDWSEYGSKSSADQRASERRSQMKLLASGQPVQTELMRLTKLRHSVWMLASYHAYLNATGDIESITVFALDISDRKDADRRIGEAQKMEAIGELTGGLAHDFNNMLGIVLGNLEMMEPDLPQDDAILVECFNAARQAATRGASVANSLLAVARRQTLDLERVDVNEALQSLIGLLRHSVGSKIQISSQLCAGRLWALADSSALSNAVLNLVINARDALEGTVGDKCIQIESDLVLLSAQNRFELLPGSYALISVEDTGQGMTEEVRQRAFDPFFTTKLQGKGTGLGLATVRGLVEQIGGAVVLESVVGQGTTVRLYLPLIELDARERQRSEAERLAALHELSILDTEPTPELDALVAQAANLCNAKTALISLIDEDRQWFKARIGLDARETPRRDAFCAHAIETQTPVFEVPDAMEDARFSANPLVMGDPFIRFYAGVPLRDSAGHALGTLCVLDPEPRMLSERQRGELIKLAAAVVEQIGVKAESAVAQESLVGEPDDFPGGRATTGAADTARVGEGRKVLVVDDEEGLCRIARRWLEAMGFGVTTCTSAEEALAFLRDQSFDVLFTDIVMPGSLDGPALARRAKVVRPGVRVVMTTGFSREPYDDLEDAQILKKPYARADLQAVFGSIRFDAADVGDSVR